jgi:hypothetical protein
MDMYRCRLVRLIIGLKCCQVISKWKITSVRQEFRREGDYEYYILLLYFKLSPTREFRSRHSHTTLIAVTVTNAKVVRIYQGTKSVVAVQ